MPHLARRLILSAVFAAWLLPPGPSAAQAAPLGDLSAFRAMADDTMRLVRTGDLAAAKVRIRDLETAWDAAAPDLRPHDRRAWTVLDKAIDRAIAALRAATPEAPASEAALDDLLATMDTLAKPA